MTVLRRFDAVLAPTKEKVLREFERHKDKFKDDALDKLLNKAAGQRFHNHSSLTFEQLKGDPDNIDKHLTSYTNGFSANFRGIFEFFEFTKEIEKMHEANIHFLVVKKFCDVDLHPDRVDNIEMGLVFENLICRFNEWANETAGVIMTPCADRLVKTRAPSRRALANRLGRSRNTQVPKNKEFNNLTN